MVHPPPSASRPINTRTRSSTVVGTGHVPPGSLHAGPPAVDLSSTSLRVVTDPRASSSAAAALSHISGTIRGERLPSNAGNPASSLHVNTASYGRKTSFGENTGPRRPSWPDPPLPTLSSIPSAPVLPTRASIAGSITSPEHNLTNPNDQFQLLLYTYKPSHAPGPSSQPSPLPSRSTPQHVASPVLVNHAALPWHVRPGDYLEIRGVKQKGGAKLKGSVEADKGRTGGEALKGVPKRRGRDGYVFRLGEDSPNIPINQIQVPESVAAAFRFQHRLEVDIVRLPDPSDAEIDYVELRFSQYLGRADMWRLGMSLENTTVHVGEKVSLAGGAIRADIQGIWRGQNRFSSGVVTAKTKTIYRSKSAQMYIFIQLCQEIWEFDEDGERYTEKVVHGLLPELFGRWHTKGTSHLVTIILFARIHYDADEVAYMNEHNITLGLTKDYAGRWCKDFFRVVIDFERRTDWNQALGEIKLALERSEREIMLDFHLDLLKGREHDYEEKRIVGKWSFAYEGNVLEAVNVALNPFDEHYVDRDLSRTGLCLCVITPGTGHFALDKNLLRLTTERMIDHGISLDLICLTKMPLHSVPLFSYVSKRPKGLISQQGYDGTKTKPATPDLLYWDAHLSAANDSELADCYSIPKWVNCSFYSKTHDKPFRTDRFIPRCKMYEIQMLGILDHNMTTVTVPLLDADADTGKNKTLDERKRQRDEFDATIFGGSAVAPKSDDEAGNSYGEKNLSVPASYQSARLLAQMEKDGKIVPRAKLTPGSVTEGLAKAVAESLPRRSPTDSTRTGTSPRSSFHLPPPSGGRDTLDLQRRTFRSPSPAPSTLSMNRNASGITSTSPSRTSVLSTIEAGSGASTPRAKLKNKSSKSSFASRFGATWLFGSLGARSQPSFPTAAVENVTRTDVAVNTHGAPVSPSVTSVASPNLPPVMPRPVPGAMIITPSTPSPARLTHRERDRDKDKPVDKDKEPTQPITVPKITRPRITADDEGRSQHGSVKFSRSHDGVGSSWGRAVAFGNRSRHVTVNPCNPKLNGDILTGDGRRWQYVRPKPSKSNQHLVKWIAFCAPASLPLTTDFMPNPQEIQHFYEANSYDIACFSDQVSFLVRQDAANPNLPLAVMKEMASQRLAQNFQFIVLPHTADPLEAFGKLQALSERRKVLLPGESATEGLRVGGASEVLRDAQGAIYLSWSNHIHRLAFDADKQSVTVQRFVRKMRHSTEPVKYECLVWPAQMKMFQRVETTFTYPNVEDKLNFNYLDRLVAGEEEEFRSTLRFWRTRYLLIPSGKDPLTVQGVVPKGEHFNPAEILITGASKVLEIMGRHQWTPPGSESKPLRLLPTTFDPSACVLDDGLMTELERLTSGKENIAGGKTLEGMTLQDVGEMMCMPNNGLIIRDRWWNFAVYEDTFTGEMFCEWLLNTFTDVKTRDEAAEWGRSLFDKGLIEHPAGLHGFVDLGHFFYRLRPTYDLHHNKRKKPKSWFGAKQATGPRDLIEKHAAMSTSPTNTANTPLGKLGEMAGLSGTGTNGGPSKKRKIKMSQRVVIDLDPGKKSDRAEVAILHADIVHNAKNAFHFELNWLGVTAGLLDELKHKCTAQAERYGLRLVEAPVEQIKDVSQKCAYRTAIPIPLALAPPLLPELDFQLAEHGTGQSANFFEYAILTRRFGFVLDVEAASRYPDPDTIEVEYSYRTGSATAAKFEYSQFCHKSGLALVQCVGGADGFLWCDNRLFIAAPARRGGGGGTGEFGSAYPGAPLAPKMTKQEEARVLREELTAFCADEEALKRFYDEVMPVRSSTAGLAESQQLGEPAEAATGEEASAEKVDQES